MATGLICLSENFVLPSGEKLDEVVSIPIRAYNVIPREKSGQWKHSHIDNWILTQYPLKKTVLRIDVSQQTIPNAKEMLPLLDAILNGSHMCVCDGNPNPHSPNYWPFQVKICGKEPNTFLPIVIYLAESDQQDPVDYVGWYE